MIINNKRIGQAYPAYIIAEMSANHNKSFEQAVKIIEAAKKAGADAVKLQTYTPDTLTIDCNNNYFKINGTIWNGKKLYDLYGEAYTPWEWQPNLKKTADKLGIDLFSTPFDYSAVDFLEKMDVPAYKIASFEIVDIPLIKRVAKTGKPIIISTGMASLGEIEDAVNAAKKAGAKDIALLKCTSAYPAPPEEINLKTIAHMSEAFNLPAGISDHTLGSSVAIAAVALGAKIVEKHFTLSRNYSGPDSAFSMEPHEFGYMVDSIRMVEKALGSVFYGPSGTEAGSRAFRRSLFVVSDMKKGEIFTDKNIRSIRPGYGLSPKYLDEIIGKTAAKVIERGTPLSWDLISSPEE